MSEEQIKIESNWKKRFFLIALPVVATFVMSAGIFISRVKIKGWIRIYGHSSFKPGSKTSFRILARKGKLNKYVDDLKVKVFLVTDRNSILVGKAAYDQEHLKALDVNIAFPPVEDGKYNLRFDIDSDMGIESWKIPIIISKNSVELEKLYEDSAGEEGGTYSSMSNSYGTADKDGVVVSLHPINGRGFKTRSRDLIFLKLQSKTGEPLRGKASLKIKSGTIRLPEDTFCLPFMVGRDLMDCMAEFKDGEEIPFKLETDSLGLDSMSLYTMTSGVSFEITYSYVKKDGSYSKERVTTFDIGSISDDAFIDFLPRIIPANKKFKLKVKGLGKGPFYLSLYNDNQWVNSKVIPLSNYFGETLIDTTGLNGFYKLQYSLSYLPIINGESNYSFWVHPVANDPEIMEKAVKKVLDTEGLDGFTKKYVNYIKDKGLIWKTGYKVTEDIHFLSGILDQYHFAPKIIFDSKHQRESTLLRMKRNGQIAIFLIMALSGLALMVVIFFAVVIFIKRRNKSIAEMSAMLEAADVEENFFKGLNQESDEIDYKRQAIAFGFIIALIVGFVIVASIWLILNVKWEM